MTSYLVLFAIVLAINLLPAFGPPTWAIIAIYAVKTDLILPILVLTGAMAAALGRFLLAVATRLLGARLLPESNLRNLSAARAALQQHRQHVILGLGLFALSPLPSAQLFEAAGLTGVRLRGFTAAFFAGRIISYSIYAYTAHGIRTSSLGEALKLGLKSPFGLIIQIGMIALLVALTRFDWVKRLGKNSREGN